MIRLSFCTSCMGRLHHLRQTLPVNIAATQGIPGIEFVLLNYASPDGLDDWIRECMQPHISSGRLTYYRADGFTHFRIAHAKNIAHLLGAGEIVCNLDADNFAGDGFAEYLLDQFANPDRIFVRSPHHRSVCGRLAFRKGDFLALGGYDERFHYGWGFDDRDIAARAAASGLRAVVIPTDRGFLRALPHSHEERTRLAEIKDRLLTDAMQKRMSEDSVASGELVANAGKEWGVARLIRNFEQALDIRRGKA